MGRVQKKLRGFTIIEMIVVVTIIAILASLVSLNLLDNAAKARDTRRIGDIAQLWKAIELYKANNAEALPKKDIESVTKGSVYIENACDTSVTGGTGDTIWAECGFFSETIRTYLNPLPQDPINKKEEQYYYGYAYDTSILGSNWYTALARMEVKTNANIANTWCYSFVKNDREANPVIDYEEQFALCH